jgi:predicted Zn-dependent protease
MRALLASSLLLLSLRASAGGESGSVWADLERAQRLFAAEQWDAAETAYLSCLENDPRLVTAHYWIGRIRERRKDLEGAAKAFEQVTGESPMYGESRKRMGNLALARNDPKAAAACFQAAADAAPNLDALLQLASARMALREFDAAEAVLRKADGFGAKDLALVELWGRLHVETGKWDLALERYSAASAAVPRDSGLRLMKAVCLEKTGKVAEGVKELEAAFRIDPANPEILERLLRAYERDASKANEREALRARLDWLRKNPPRVRAS